MQIIPIHEMPWWNSVSITFTWIVLGLYVGVFLIGVCVTICDAVRDKDWSQFGNDIWSLTGLVSLIGVGVGILWLVFCLIGYSAGSYYYREEKTIESLENLGYSKIQISQLDYTSGKFTASDDGKFVDGALIEYDDKFRVVLMDSVE